MDPRPIGLFDSGIGGLTVWHALRRLLPEESLLYLSDTAYFPYGARTPEELRLRARQIVTTLLEAHCKLVVVACNTATVAALADLRDRFPTLPFVGVVPVVKVLAEQTSNGVIALLSTPGTAESPYLADLIARFAAGRQVINVGCEGLADAIERGESEGSAVRALLQRYLAPVQASGADVLGLGCTHYPFLRQQIAAALGPAVRIFDSADPVARRVHDVLIERDARAPAGTRPAHRFLTTGEPAPFRALASRLLALPEAAIAVAPLSLPSPSPSGAVTALADGN